MKKLLLLFSMAFVLTSCETDSVEEVVQNPNQEIVGYKYTTDSPPSDPAYPHYSSETIGTLQNGKFYTETTTRFLNGIQDGAAVTTQTYFYSNDRLDHFDRGDVMIYYYYDTTGNLIGCTGIWALGGTTYERYTHLPNNVVYCESVNLPYNDPNAVAGNRRILQRDNDGNVISAGHDHNMDGIASDIYTFTYTNGNMTAMQKPDGSVVHFNYTNVIDTYGHVAMLSRGKQVSQFPCASSFSTGNATALLGIHVSRDIASDDYLLSSYEILPNSFYNKKTDVNGSWTGVLEFFFN